MYQLEPERGNGRKRTVHRKLPFPCDLVERTIETSTIVERQEQPHLDGGSAVARRGSVSDSDSDAE